MLIPVRTTQFKRDYKLAEKRGRSMPKLKKVMEMLTKEDELDSKYRDHKHFLQSASSKKANEEKMAALQDPLRGIAREPGSSLVGREQDPVVGDKIVIKLWMSHPYFSAHTEEVFKNVNGAWAELTSSAFQLMRHEYSRRGEQQDVNRQDTDLHSRIHGILNRIFPQAQYGHDYSLEMTYFER